MSHLHARVTTDTYQATHPRRVFATNMCAKLLDTIGPSGNWSRTTQELRATVRPQRRAASLRYRAIARGSGR